ncbi:hypothetical protein FCM49_01395 [Mycoplasma bovis]|uniref:Uncharacterized protein n=1 Tax=Mycoplasmopsis bovis CQ-W70 TaxID=1316930 RepID=A0A059Y518_MYCBV|nr:hypothetical protein [Mycoplasmopsis bovis]AEI90457.1 conserved hypothetical protein [Mycoplasmopsis bovis Hubei-1]AFM52127.1 putative transmembrane protein [Mycoplasmopsis bovis HB0801]AIA34313.1 hypothetical protein K668_03715 [Mycoplasmopsis bovis CQ-W70]AKO50910.1 membrane protein [Mycoplasmopsis bovis]AQU86014.1 hypothetical protein B0W43_04000 [Mycoplasmopsis bovis]
MDGSLTMWIILGVLVAIILFMFIFSSVKNKINKKRKEKRDAEFRKKSAEYANFLAIKISCLMNVNEEFLKKFEPSIGTFKMRDIVSVANRYLKTIEDDLDFREYIVSSDNNSEFLKNFIKLTHTRCNNWSNQCAEFKNELEKKIAKMDAEFVAEKSSQETLKIREFYEKGLIVNELA